MKKKPTEDLMHALWGGDAHAIEKVFKSGVDLTARDREGRTLLMEATLEKRADLVKTLLEHGADPKLADRDGATALHFAAQAHQPEIVQLLLDAGALVDAQDRQGNTPLFKALSTFKGERDGDAIWALLLAGADRTCKNTHNVSPEALAQQPSNYDLGQFFR
ncbi:MAG: ankyrin repeat domain-containing protein [Myxococcaceae bacterium]